ncbi:HNH endonuclease [Sinomicrobium sp. M5D2P17]
MRNPKWHPDEILLALDLYFRLEPGQIYARNEEIIQISNLLKKLPIHKIIPDITKFRNPNGVSLKLSNFLAIDPNYKGKGMQAYSTLDKELFDKFVDNKEELKRIVQQIKSTLNGDINLQLHHIETEEKEFFEAKEGEIIYKLHKLRERNPTLTKKKKDSYYKKHGKLDCEVCGFDFYEVYGELGKGFIECHHRVPLAQLDGKSKTKLKDLALVCANCHRMLHRDMGSIGVEELSKMVRK